MPRIQLTPPGTPDLSWQSPSKGSSLFLPASVRSRRFLCGVLGLVGGLALLCTLINLDSSSYLDKVSQTSRAQLERVWQQIGALDTLDFDHPCERTLLWRFSGKSGFGSEYGMFLRAATYAKENNYTLLTASRSWDYGDYEDYFEKPVIHCVPPTGTDDPDNHDLVLIGTDGWRDAPHLVGRRSGETFHALDEWLMETQIDTELMKKLPPLNLDVPLPYGQTVPPGVQAALALENSVMQSLWRPKPRLYEMVEELKYQLQLVPDAYRGHVIGIHYRGGDKLVSECPWPVCGNATALLQSALDLIPHLPEPTCVDCKPRIALMTIEPDALQLFRDSPLATHFTIDPLPPPPGGLKGHTQKEFNEAGENEILDDTFAMLRDIAVLSLNADGFVVSANSNVGVVALVMGGPGRPISSVDFRFKATTRPLSEYFTGELTPGAPGWRAQAEKAKAAGKPHIALGNHH